MTGGPSPATPNRRRLVAGLCLVGILPVTAAAAQDVSAPAILLVSRTRVLNETDAARVLREAERELSARLQSEIDSYKAAFDIEEKELAAQRPTMDREVFEVRVADFDRRVRQIRRQAQERAGELQKSFQEARLLLVKALDPLLEQIRSERGALLILNADDALAKDTAIDITEDVIVLFNASVVTPEIPELLPVTIEGGANSSAD